MRLLILFLTVSLFAPFSNAYAQQNPQNLWDVIQQAKNKGSAFGLPPMSKQSEESLTANNTAPALWVAISLSMPKESLEKLAIDAARARVVLAIRGFVDGSIQKTNELMAAYAKKGVQVQIYPQLFSHFGITAVPTYVATQIESECLSNPNCGKGDFTSVSGDVSLSYALQRLHKQAKPELQSIIASSLQRLGAKP